jgi:cytoskeletal protein RodZ
VKHLKSKMNMKKTLFALSVMTILLVGVMSVNSVVANQVNDDPPKKEVKAKKSCCSPAEMKTCKTPCTEKTDVKADDKKKETSTSTSVSTETKETTKTDPDKK